MPDFGWWTPTADTTDRHQPVASPDGRRLICWPDRRDRRRQVGGAGRVRPPGRGDAVDRRGRPRAARRPARSATQLLERWGGEVVADGRSTADRVGAIVFEPPEELAWLESVLHPLVGGRVVEWRAVAARGRRSRSSRCRCCSRPAWRTRSTRRLRGRRRPDPGRRGGRARHRAARGPKRPPALPGGEGGAGDARDPQRRLAGRARARGGRLMPALAARRQGAA